MTWKQLLASNRVRTHTTSKQELDGLRSIVERDLVDAGLAGLLNDRRFATAYNAALQRLSLCSCDRTPGRRTALLVVASCFQTVLPERFQLGEPVLTLLNIMACREERHDGLSGGDRRSRPGDVGDGGNREEVAPSRIIDLDHRGRHGAPGVKNCLADDRGPRRDGFRFPRGFRFHQVHSPGAEVFGQECPVRRQLEDLDRGRVPGVDLDEPIRQT